MRISLSAAVSAAFVLALLSTTSHAVALPAQKSNQTDENYTDSLHSDHFQVFFWKDSTKMGIGKGGAQALLNRYERIWDSIVVGWGFPYQMRSTTPVKTNLYLTFNPAKGYAGGGPQGNHGGMIILSKNAIVDIFTPAHEFTHVLQAGSTMGWGSAMMMGETHAQWMGTKVNNIFMGSAWVYNEKQHLTMIGRDVYWEFGFLEFLKDNYGGVYGVNQLLTQNPPAGTYWDIYNALMYTKKWTRSQLNDMWGKFALHMAYFDFKDMREVHPSWDAQWYANDLERRNVWHYLNVVDAAKRRYAIPSYYAPQAYSQNPIAIFPDAGKDTMRVVFQGISQSAAAGSWPNNPAPKSDWRWGLVAVTPNGNNGYPSFRYVGPFAASVKKAELVKRPNETKFYLVVAGTPNVDSVVRYPYYTQYRYPWMAQFENCQPQGYQSNAWNFPAFGGGSKHPNGGGFVASGATVAATAYVGAGAQVLGTAKVLGNAKLYGNSIVAGNAVVSGNAVLKDRALVLENANIGENAVISHDAQIKGMANIKGSAWIRDGARITAGVVQGTAVLGDIARIHDAKAIVSGTTKIFGEGAVGAVTVNKGVFYEFVKPENVLDPSIGANRTARLVEATAVPNYVWTKAAPVVKLTASTASALAGTPVTFTASATDLDGKVTSTQLLVNGVVVGSATTGTLKSVLSNLAAGTHTIQARATDNEGVVGTSSSVKVTITWNYRLTATAANYWYGGLVVNYALPSTLSSATVIIANAGGTPLRTATVAKGSTRVRFTAVSGYAAGNYIILLKSGNSELARLPLSKM